MFKRDLFDNYGRKIIGEYYFEENAEREIFDFDGNKIDLLKVSPEEDNYIRSELDSFEDGFNEIVNGYEQKGKIGVTTITIRRKIAKINFFEKEDEE